MAEGRYTRIKSRFWSDEKVRLWAEEAKLLALYLLTSPHNNILGCYVLPKLYICADLGWDLKRLGKPFEELLSDGFIKYDESTSLILITNYLKHNPIENGNQAKAAEKQLAELPKSPILQDLKQSIKRLDKPFLKPLMERIGEPVTVTVTVTVTETTPISPPEETEDEIIFEPDDFDDDSGGGEVFNTFEKEFGRLLSTIEFQKIAGWTKEFKPELINHALSIAVLGGNRSLRYIDGILLRWKDAGVQCMQDVETLEKDYERRKKKQVDGSNDRASPNSKAALVDQFLGLEGVESG